MGGLCPSAFAKSKQGLLKRPRMRYNRRMDDYIAELLAQTKPAYDRYREIDEQLSLPEVAGDGRLYRHLERKARSLRALYSAHLGLQEAQEAYERTLAEMQKGDPILKPLYQEEVEKYDRALLERAEETEALLAVGATGGDVACVMTVRPYLSDPSFAKTVADSYKRYLDGRGIGCDVVFADKQYRLTVGEGGYGLLQRESGLQKRTQGGAATVAVMPVVEDVKVQIDPEDVRVDIYCSSGKGGQNINKVETAVRLTHLPTGTVVTCQDERSQLANKRRAMEHLLAKLQAEHDRLYRMRYVAEREEQIKDRSNPVRVWDEQKGKVTDKRTGVAIPLKDAERGDIHRLVIAAIKDKV